MGVSAQNSGFRHFWFRGSAHLRAILWGCRWKPFPGAPTAARGMNTPKGSETGKAGVCTTCHLPDPISRDRDGLFMDALFRWPAI